MKKKYSINILFSENIIDESKLIILGNDLLLKTAFGNIMDNACKYSFNNLSEILVDASQNELILYFKDNGIGIPQEELKMIFQPFYRAKIAIGVKGHGIGLSLVEKIIGQHNGSIEVNSEINKGSEFIIYLPSEIKS
ncbi:MAG: sensor histidine kinase [Sphingobacterium sp.]|nr:sensor histidine kinase [Sphingobacterium sp.]